jgi:predicted MPP superfamily phosphohydrolase
MTHNAQIRAATLALPGIAILALNWLIRISQENRAVVIGLLALLLISILYNVYDNQRIVLRQETVYLENLPPAFDGFKILQLSDLHGKSFGPGQANLIAKVNAVGYDMIAFTGDMETPSLSFSPLIALIDGIAHKENLFYVNGNRDLAYSSITGIKTEIGKILEAHGCILLTKPHPMVRDGQTLWLANALHRHYRGYDVHEGLPRNGFRTDDLYRAYQDHFTELETISAQIKDKRDINIALMHIPFTKNELEKQIIQADYLDYDLILAGHYHGGQFRIPGYGAFAVPVDSFSGRRFFPKQKYVSGLAGYDGIQQYVSRGLGASNIPFRLFNSPEINLLILKAK